MFLMNLNKYNTNANSIDEQPMFQQEMSKELFVCRSCFKISVTNVNLKHLFKCRRYAITLIEFEIIL